MSGDSAYVRVNPAITDENVPTQATVKSFSHKDRSVMVYAIAESVLTGGLNSWMRCYDSVEIIVKRSPLILWKEVKPK